MTDTPCVTLVYIHVCTLEGREGRGEGGGERRGGEGGGEREGRGGEGRYTE